VIGCVNDKYCVRRIVKVKTDGRGEVKKYKIIYNYIYTFILNK
jgi:hypothetical protein